MQMRLGVLVCCMFVCGIANAETSERDGLFLRLSFGFGFGEDWQSTDSVPKEARLAGVGSVGDLAIGGIVAENLALHATFYSSTLADPVYQPSGIETAGNNNETYRVSTGGLGVGLTYYIMPLNLYLSGSAGFGTRQTERTVISGNTTNIERIVSDIGVGYQLAIGKEWWVSSEWSIGVGAQAIYVRAAMPMDGCDGCRRNRESLVSGIVFSATYN